MDVTAPNARRDPAAIEAALLKGALALVQDPAQARALATQTLEAALDGSGPSGLPSQAQLFRALRQTYHSVERSRRGRPARDALVTSLAREQGLAAERGG